MTRDYGILIRSKISYGTDYIEAAVVARESDKDYPLGCSSDGENSYDPKVPKHMHGLMVDGLGMYGFVNVSASDVNFIGHELEYRDVYTIDIPKAARMLKTLKRVVARMRKSDAREPGDRFMALAKAMKLSFAVEDRGANHPNRWRYMSLTEGRDRYRQVIEETIAEVKKRKGLAA